ncbi:G-protein coupled receptor GRL101-like [Babylonia areolata]|uniref:G-protein coupled receptor GRL101-like n=1 Tax=Babylonia areolata TaxID=304850 RepID=UPI003FD0CD28
MVYETAQDLRMKQSCPQQDDETHFVLPVGFNPLNCHAPSDEISSCKAMLRSDLYRVVLSVFATLTLLGNLFSFIFRVFVNRTAATQSYGVFVIHLCVSDFLMGLYLSVIGVADRMFKDTFLWNDVSWRNSVACTVAGLFSFVSSEVSAFTICLITLDRFLVLHFPFSSVHFGQCSAHVACVLAWCSGVVLAFIPLLPLVNNWQFYRQKNICIPLPITRNDSPGHTYSFGVIVCLNFVLFLLIAAGQAFIYWSVRVNSMSAGKSNKKSTDFTIARRLITVAISDFICWFPIGLLGLMAYNDILILSEVNVAMALLVMPLNSAINPFLYTLNILLEKRRRARDQRLEKLLLMKIEAKRGRSD